MVSIRVGYRSFLTLKRDVAMLNVDISIMGTMRGDSIPGYKPVDNSFGPLLSGLYARTIREDGTGTGMGKSGEPRVKEDCISKGYLNDEEATAKPFTKSEWLMTGGIFTADEKGNFQ